MIHQLPGSASLLRSLLICSAGHHYIFRVYLLDLWNLKIKELLLHCIHNEYMHKSFPWPTWWYISYQVLLHFCNPSSALVAIIVSSGVKFLTHEIWTFKSFSFIHNLWNTTATCVIEFLSLLDDTSLTTWRFYFNISSATFAYPLCCHHYSFEIHLLGLWSLKFQWASPTLHTYWWIQPLHA